MHPIILIVAIVLVLVVALVFLVAIRSSNSKSGKGRFDYEFEEDAPELEDDIDILDLIDEEEDSPVVKKEPVTKKKEPKVTQKKSNSPKVNTIKESIKIEELAPVEEKVKWSAPEKVFSVDDVDDDDDDFWVIDEEESNLANEQVVKEEEVAVALEEELIVVQDEEPEIDFLSFTKQEESKTIEEVEEVREPELSIEEDVQAEVVSESEKVVEEDTKTTEVRNMSDLDSYMERILFYSDALRDLKKEVLNTTDEVWVTYLKDNSIPIKVSDSGCLLLPTRDIFINGSKIEKGMIDASVKKGDFIEIATGVIMQSPSGFSIKVYGTDSLLETNKVEIKEIVLDKLAMSEEIVVSGYATDFGYLTKYKPYILAVLV